MSRSHGMSKTKIYGIWSAMMSRCNNPNSGAYHNYGGRGIRVCERWHRFEDFYADMGERPQGKSLERINNDKGYSPENCIWAEREVQARNRRDTRYLTSDGVTKSVAEWSDETGISIGTICRRLQQGWSDHEAVSIPIITKRKGIPRGENVRNYA